jgi:uncharacterized protein YktB (UPF0637 family)
MTGIIARYIANSLSVPYLSKRQRADQINENLNKCLTEIRKNKAEKLDEKTINEQIERTNQIIERKRIAKDLNEWPAFAKNRRPFSKSNYWQYLLVDDTRNFVFTNAANYPKEQETIAAINEIFELSEKFNFQIQDFERIVLSQVNFLIQQNIFDKEQYEPIIKENTNRYLTYYSNFMKEFNPRYNSINPDQPSVLEIQVTIVNPEFH